jgi:hypothetical protein
LAYSSAVTRGLTAEAVVGELRRRRASRRRRPRGWELIAYVEAAVLLLGYAALGLWLLVGGPPIGGALLEPVRAHGPAVAGLAVALLTGLSLRSGLHGGPLTVDPADVHHLLLAPVSRRAVLLPVALRRLGLAAGAGAVAGGIAGILTAARLPGGYPAWIASGAAAGLLVGLLSVAAALLVSARHVPASWVYGCWLALLALAAADLAAGTALTPPTWFGMVALEPLRPSGLAALAVPAAAALALAGLTAVGETSVEALDRRAGLVSQLRFAAASRDVRSVTRAGHQLAAEVPRGRPWLRLPAPRRGTPAVWRRHWQSLLRWPPGRVVRVAALAVAIAGALALTWAGATYFLAVAGGLAYVVGLEVLEPWAETVDRPDLTDSLPVGRLSLLVRHLLAAVVAAAAVGAVTLVALAALRPPPAVLAAAAVLVVPSAIGAVCGAAVRGRADTGASSLPQDQVGIQAFLLVLQVAAPPSLAVLGLVPVLLARGAYLAGQDPVTPALAGGLVVAAVLPAIVLLARSGSAFSGR